MSGTASQNGPLPAIRLHERSSAEGSASPQNDLVCAVSRAALRVANRLRRKTIFARPFKLIWGVQLICKKYFHLRKYEIVHKSARPGSLEGRTRRHERGARDAVDADAVARRAADIADGEGVWS